MDLKKVKWQKADHYQAKSRSFMCAAIGCCPFCKNYANLYFDAKHLEKGLKRRW